MVSMLSVFVHAAELQVTYQIGNATETVTSEVSTEGSLATLLGGEDNAMKVTQLSVKGNLNFADIGLLKKMAGRTEKTGSEVTGSLKSLNLSEATFFFAMAAGKMVPSNMFQYCRNLQHVDLDGMTEIGIQAFADCTALTDISIPASVTKIHEGAFANTTAVTKVFVHSGKQIDARYYDNVKLNCSMTRKCSSKRSEFL